MDGLYVVTGAASGIGAGIARALHQAGAQIVVVDRDAQGAEAVAAEVGGEYRVLDVSDPDAVAAAYGSLGPLSGSIHCAGIARSTPLLTASLERWRRVTSVHLDGTFLCLQAAARNMVANDIAGSIVNTSSINATFGHRGLGAYGASKAGISMLTKVAALELAAVGIRVNAVAPGIVASAMSADLVADPDAVRLWSATNTAARIGQPADIADAVVFLCSPESRWLNGQTLALDGGASLRIEPKTTSDDKWTAEALKRAATTPLR
jgi:3-oxoacyl-[acyl-carrier protein] reductase